jgi:hypothetical protein
MNKTKQNFKMNGWEGSQGGIYGTLLQYAQINTVNPSLSHETYPQIQTEYLPSVQDIER